ncbi:MAG: GNAT family N-acetyltransferase [Betaproteobacteria bacterium]
MTEKPTSPALIRAATADDVPLILDLIRGLAEYEKLSHLVTATEAGLRESLFGANRGADVVIAFTQQVPVGLAVFVPNFSTFLGKSGIWLEDIFVKPEHRGCGYGKALLLHVARIAHARGCGRVEWSVLDWNTPAIDFYKSLGAVPLDDWTIFRLADDALIHLANIE